jgi:hypothetical protein
VPRSTSGSQTRQLVRHTSCRGEGGCGPYVAWDVMMLVWICIADASKLM